MIRPRWPGVVGLYAFNASFLTVLKNRGSMGDALGQVRQRNAGAAAVEKHGMVS